SNILNINNNNNFDFCVSIFLNLGQTPLDGAHGGSNTRARLEARGCRLLRQDPR
ncbi:hypothetical protein TIFTF001_053992, partial [Ficus carica]